MKSSVSIVCLILNNCSSKSEVGLQTVNTYESNFGYTSKSCRLPSWSLNLKWFIHLNLSHHFIVIEQYFFTFYKTVFAYYTYCLVFKEHPYIYIPLKLVIRAFVLYWVLELC
jgi:hypothetical protein